MNYLLLIGLVSILITFNGTLAFSEEMTLFAESKSPTYNEGVYPSITGKVTDSQGTPLSNVYVYALFPSKTAEAMTNHQGKFSLNPLTSYPPGEYSIDVYARTETVLSRMTVIFEIVEPVNQEDSEWLSNNTQANNLSFFNFTGLSSINGTYSKHDMILYQLSLENQQNQTQVDVPENATDFVDIQRKNSQIKLEQDLKNSRELQNNENRDAFASFVSKLDSIVHAIFWNQFEFTQKISDDAYQAKLDALDDGKTSQDAMKIYQKEAAVSRTELTEYMKQLNIKHGFTNSTIQDQFDENGKIPRNNDN